jgi:hypothetical protein
MQSALPPVDDLALRNLVARYALFADAGDGLGIAALFTDDGEWVRENESPSRFGGSGLPPTTVVGRNDIAALISRVVDADFQRKFRHQMTDLLLEPAYNTDEARGFCRALITDWRDGPGKLAMCATYHWKFRRASDGWLIASVRLSLLPS